MSRYLFALQIKQDVSCGSLTCNDSSAALMVSHIIQCKILMAVSSFSSKKSTDQISAFEDTLCFSHTELIIKHCHKTHRTPFQIDYLCCRVAMDTFQLDCLNIIVQDWFRKTTNIIVPCQEIS